MGWLARQKHKPFNGERWVIVIRFSHDCVENNPSRTICFPIVSAWARDNSTHSTYAPKKEFSDVFLMAFCKGQAFGNV